jgi:6-pyruvoyltetrahydropterin/6-carboxytetrahydropterin synthase
MFKIPTKVEVYGKDIRTGELKYHEQRVLVSKEFTFDSAHHIHEYDGKCKNLHGHTYKVVFGISSFTDYRGLGIDFGDIKKMWKEKIEIHLDHKYLNESLPNMNTTAENIVVWIYERMKDEIAYYHHLGARVEWVRLYETPTAYAEARREWMEE